MNNNGYITFHGPSVDEGSIDIEKAGKVLSSTAKIFQKYIKTLTDHGKIEKLDNGQKIVLKTNAIKNNCTTIELTTGLISQVVTSQPVELLTVLQVGKTVFNGLGLQEFCKQFMGTLGKQLALKVFAGGKPLTLNTSSQNKLGEVIIKNEIGETKKVSLSEWEFYLTAQHDISPIFALEKDKEESMVVGYNQDGQKYDTGQIKYTDKISFVENYNYDIEKKLSEPFEEEKSFDIKIIGKFLDYYGLAHRYHFSFQARKEQSKIGKQKILCMVEKSEISRILDLLKPENDSKGNVVIIGKATNDGEGKIDKIKIETIHTKGNTLFDVLEKEII